MSDITRTLIVWKSVLYEGVKHRAKAITPPANSLFWKIENDAWGIKQILYHKTIKEAFLLFACAPFCSKIFIRRRLMWFIFITEQSTGKAFPFVKSDHM